MRRIRVTVRTRRGPSTSARTTPFFTVWCSTTGKSKPFFTRKLMVGYTTVASSPILMYELGRVCG